MYLHIHAVTNESSSPPPRFNEVDNDGSSDHEKDNHGGGSGGSAPTAQQVATAVWSEDLTNKTSGAGKTVKDINKTTKATLGVSV